MCKLGDIIVVKEFKNECGKIVSKHSFVVIHDEQDYVEGLKYDFVSNMMCSFHNNNHKNKKLKYKENLPIKEKLIYGSKINSKEGFIKADQLYYFNKKKIEYIVLAHIDSSLLNELIALITELHNEGKLRIVTTNLKEEVHN